MCLTTQLQSFIKANSQKPSREDVVHTCCPWAKPVVGQERDLFLVPVEACPSQRKRLIERQVDLIHFGDQLGACLGMHVTELHFWQSWNSEWCQMELGKASSFLGMDQFHLPYPFSELGAELRQSGAQVPVALTIRPFCSLARDTRPNSIRSTWAGLSVMIGKPDLRVSSVDL